MKSKPAFCAILMIGVTCVAGAQEGPSTPEEAEALFSRAQEHAELGQWEIALGEFRQVYTFLDRTSHPRASLVFFDTAVCLEHLDRQAEAAEDYERFLADAPADAPQRSLAEQSLAAIRARMPAPAPPTASTPTTLPAPPAPASGLTLSPIGIVIASIGLASIVAGAIAGGFAIANDNSLRSQCSAAGVCPTALNHWADEITALAATADGLFFGGLGVTAIGVVLTFLLGDSGSSSSHAWLEPAYSRSW
jgi:hypothetical protein